MAKSLARARYSPHGEISEPHIPRHRSRGDILRLLLLWKRHGLLRHPSICYWCLNRSKQAWVGIVHVHLLRHLLLEPHLLHLLLNLGNLLINSKNLLGALQNAKEKNYSPPKRTSSKLSFEWSQLQNLGGLAYKKDYVTII